MSNLVQFSFQSQAVRVQSLDGQPWFVLKDILAAMGTKTPITQAVNSVNQQLGDGLVKELPIPDALGRLQPTTIAAQPATTFLVSRGNTEVSRRLNRWLHTEVLPAIFSTGSYRAGAPAAAAPASRDQIEHLKREVLRRVPAWGKLYRWRSGGVTVPECAALLDCAESTVRRQLAEMAALDIVPVVPEPISGPRPVPPELQQIWAELHLTLGQSIASIARQYDRAESTVWDAIQRATGGNPNQRDLFADQIPGVLA